METPVQLLQKFYETRWDKRGRCYCSICRRLLNHNDIEKAPSELIFIANLGMFELCGECWKELKAVIPIESPLLQWSQKLQDFIDARKTFRTPGGRIRKPDWETARLWFQKSS